MATYTPNYNLYKPSGTDQFDNFLTEFGNNMDTIDQNLGGGGGSSTLAGLSDVSLTTPVTGDALIYDGAEWANSPLADVATSGDYADLINTPTIPTNTSDLNNDSGFLTSSDISAVGLSGDYSDLLNAPSLATVATSGDYGDLLNKPTIPTVNDGTLTIQQNGTTVGTFTANQSGNTTINLTGGSGSKHTIVNESGTALADEPNLQFTDGLTATDDSVNTKTKVGINTTFTEASTRANIASGDSFSTILGKIKKFFTDLKTVAFTGSYNDLSDKPTIPDISTKVSKSGDDMTGALTMKGQDINLGTASSSSNDSADLVWQYGNGNEKARIWADDTYTSGVGLNYRVNKSDGTQLYAGRLATMGEVDGKVSKSGDTMTGALTINRSSDVQAVFSRNNTGTSTAITSIDIGNNVADGTAGSTYGRIRLFGKRAYRTNITASASTANRDIEFPNASGTVALTSDVDAKVSKSGDTVSGTLHVSELAVDRGSHAVVLDSPSGLTSDVYVTLPDTTGVIAIDGTPQPTKCPRVESKNLNNSSSIHDGVSMAKFTECGPSCTNLPDASWYFIMSFDSADSNYGAQLAIGMTTDYCWVRRKDGGGWRSWIRLV